MGEGSTTRIARYAYEQVLDATKHQDDKINRLLTAIAFLTGGAIALAGLNGATYLTMRFQFGRYELELALLAVGAFFVGVVATVLMLIGSLTTPLRLPSVPRLSGGDVPGPPRKHPVYASADAEMSPFYFYEISKLSFGQWQTKWTPAKEHALAAEETDALVRETHNLAVRTEYKYGRTTEAVAVLSFALAWLAIAAVLVLAAAGFEPGSVASTGSGSSPTVPYDLWSQAALSLVLSGFVWLQIRTSIRHEVQSVEELDWVNRRRSFRRFVRFAFPVSASAVPTLLLSPVESPSWSAFCTLVIIASFLLFVAIRADVRDPAESLRKDRALWASLVLMLVYAAGAWIGAKPGWGELRAVLASATTLVLLISALAASQARTRRRLAEFRKTLVQSRGLTGTTSARVPRAWWAELRRRLRRVRSRRSG